MHFLHVRPVAAAIAAALIPFAALADSVRVRIDSSASPFPSDRYTVRDWSQNTFRRVNLPHITFSREAIAAVHSTPCNRGRNTRA